MDQHQPVPGVYGPGQGHICSHNTPGCGRVTSCGTRARVNLCFKCIPPPVEAEALAEWTTKRPGKPGFYWWRYAERDVRPEVVELRNTFDDEWDWTILGSEETISEAEGADSLWWPVRLDPPPLGS
jgi:hypothetical protein